MAEHLVYTKKVIAKMNELLAEERVLSEDIVWLRSGRRLKSIKCRTNRYSNSFLPTAIRTFNVSLAH